MRRHVRTTTVHWYLVETMRARVMHGQPCHPARVHATYSFRIKSATLEPYYAAELRAATVAMRAAILKEWVGVGVTSTIHSLL
jgi:hypothetical protein